MLTDHKNIFESGMIKHNVPYVYFKKDAKISFSLFLFKTIHQLLSGKNVWFDV